MGLLHAGVSSYVTKWAPSRCFEAGVISFRVFPPTEREIAIYEKGFSAVEEEAPLYLAFNDMRTASLDLSLRYRHDRIGAGGYYVFETIVTLCAGFVANVQKADNSKNKASS